MLTKFTVESLFLIVISRYIHLSNHYVLHLKLTMLHISYISENWEKSFLSNLLVFTLPQLLIVFLTICFSSQKPNKVYKL